MSEIKRPHEDLEVESEMIGPLPPETSAVKKRKVLQFEDKYLENLPSAETYEKSYMHRDTIIHLLVTKTNFLITASVDGHIKFWKKTDEGIEFVKHFRSHLGKIQSVAVNSPGLLLCSVGTDKAMKIFDVINFDMINMFKLGYVPGVCEWIHKSGDAISAVAVSDEASSKIFVYDARGSNDVLHTLDKLHTKPVSLIKYNTIFETVISVDKAGILEYWSGLKADFKTPKVVQFDSKLDTDLYDFVKHKTQPTGLSFSPDGKQFATISTDRKVRVFKFLTGKLSRVFDESLQNLSNMQQEKPLLPNMEFGKRMAGERDLGKSDSFLLPNIVFDESGYFVLYATMLGVKVVNLYTNKCLRVIGKQENVRILQLALFQGRTDEPTAVQTLEMKTSENPTLQTVKTDPTIFCTGFKKNRFYIFTQREPEDAKSADCERDVFNEKPSKEDIVAATEAGGSQRLYESCIIHTSLGDFHCKLFPKECPKTVENFCIHSKNGYFKGHIFHRVIKGFMVQTGDPTGTGTGGESIWGGEFEDEFHPSLRHDRPYTLSMANAGADSNGSQFFVTVIPTPWLDNKHTVFGRVTKGMEVVQNISNVKTNPKTDKPYDDVSIISVTLK